MALNFNGSSSGLARSGSIVSGYPFTMFAWTRATTLKTGFVVEVAIDPGSRGTHEGHGALGDGSRMRAWSTIDSSVSAFSTRSETLGDWVPCMVVFAATNVRRVYYGSGAVASETTPIPQTPSLLNMLSVGKQAVKSANYWAGDIACVGIWGVELSAADFATLAAGAVPSTVQAASLIDYWSLLTQAATQTGLNGRVLTATNTTQAASHPITESAGTQDTTAPTLSGSITVSNLSASGYTLTWPAASDNIGVAGYDYSLDGGTNWLTLGNVLTVNVSGRTPGSTDAVRVRARDAAGNLSAVLSTAVTLPDTTAPTLTGSITVSALTTSSYTFSWPAGADNVAVTAYECSLDGGTNWSNVGNVLSANASGRTPGSTDQVRVRALDAAGNRSTPALSTSVTLLVSQDVTAPTMNGSISVSAITTTSYTLSWPAASDNIGVASYQRSLDGGTNWLDVGNVLTVNISGRTAGSTDQVRVRAADAAGNLSTALATSVTLLSGGGGSGTLTTPALKNNTGTLLANLTGVTVNVYNQSTGVLILQKTGLTSSSAGIVSFSDPLLTVGVAYAFEVVTPSNGRRLPLGTAS